MLNRQRAAVSGTSAPRLRAARPTSPHHQRTLRVSGTSAPRLRAARGTVLLMFPAALMVMVILGAIVVDVGYTTIRGRELRAVAASAANDSLAALDIVELRTTGRKVIDEAAARRTVAEAIAAGPLPDARIVAVVIDRFEIAVTLALDLELVMAPALGDLRQVTLVRTERAAVVT
ncbi:MAG: hypothetical protein OXB92_11940 [Acidimicrobiaceae bacterium]|nr:hypothetical protein [Acidimicrobiaceae bacterium]